MASKLRLGSALPGRASGSTWHMSALRAAQVSGAHSVCQGPETRKENRAQKELSKKLGLRKRNFRKRPLFYRGFRYPIKSEPMLRRDGDLRRRSWPCMRPGATIERRPGGGGVSAGRCRSAAQSRFTNRSCIVQRMASLLARSSNFRDYGAVVAGSDAFSYSDW